jgi:hypothetical protein
MIPARCLGSCGISILQELDDLGVLFGPSLDQAAIA